VTAPSLSLEDRLKDAATELLLVRQDCGLLRMHCGAQETALQEGRAVVLALLDATDGTHTFEAVEAASERARGWLAAIGGG